MFPAISFLAVDRNTSNDKLFIRIGEIHKDCIEKNDSNYDVEIRDRDEILKLIKTAAGSNRKIMVFLEVPPYEAESIKDFTSKVQEYGCENGLIYSLVRLNEENKKKPLIPFKYIDIFRGPFFYDFMVLTFPFKKMDYFKSVFIAPTSKYLHNISNQTPAGLSEALKKQGAPLIKDVLKAWSNYGIRYNLSMHSVKQLLDELDGAVKCISKKLLELDPYSKPWPILWGYYEKLTDAINKATYFFKEFVGQNELGDHGTCFSCISNALRRILFLDVCQQIDQWLEPLMIYLTDAAIFIQLLDAFDKYDVVISIGGAFHARGLSIVNEGINMKTVFQQDLNLKTTEGGSKRYFSNDELKGYLHEVKQTLG